MQSGHSSNLVTGTPTGFGGRVNDLIRVRGCACPASLAVAAPDATLSYAELLAQASALSARLRELGVEPDIRVGLCAPRSSALIVGALAVLEAGGAYVAMDPTYPRERLRYMLGNSGARVVVTTPSSAMPDCGIAMVYVDVTAPAAAADIPATHDADTGDELAYVIYTSGSTGYPKGVMVEHRSLRRLVEWHCQEFGVTDADRALQIASPGFDAYAWEIWSYLAAGASLHIPHDDIRADPIALRDWILAEKITMGFAPTALAEALMAVAWPPAPSLRTILTGGDVLHRSPHQRLPFTVINNYGLTEATVVSTSGEVPSTAAAVGVPSIGRPIEPAEIYVVDQNLKVLPDGAEGEVLVGGQLVARGYLNDPVQTAQSFIPDHLGNRAGGRLFRTRDLARVTANGDLVFIGRADSQIKMRGYRIETDEIAATLTRHPAVRSSVVVARTVRNGELELLAYVVPSFERSGDGVLSEFLAGLLPAYMIPSEYIWLDKLPISANGKIDSNALPLPELHRAVEWNGSSGASTEIEEILTDMIADILGLDTIGVDEDFFQAGGHSMMAAQFIIRLEERFSVTTSLRYLFDNPTVRALAAEVERLLVTELEGMSEEEAARTAGHSTDAAD